jgi:hypothetical protein
MPGVKGPTLTIDNGDTDSDTIGEAKLATIAALGIFAPAALTGTVKVYVTNDGGTSWQKLKSGGADIEVAAGGCVIVHIAPYFPIEQLRLTSSAAEGAERVFTTRVAEKGRI